MRRTVEMNLDWKFHWGEAEDASYKGYDDRAWRRVTLPHDWSVEHPFDQCCSSGTGYLPGGVGWYRKRFTLPEGVEKQRVFVRFGGVYQHARVWINGHYLGMHAYGYTSFTYELTGRVCAGENVLCVRAEHIHLADSRWFTGAGINRDVTLTIAQPRCFLPDGIFAHTDAVQDDEALIAVESETDGAEQLRVRLLDEQGVTVASGEGAADACLKLRVPQPRLWSPESPALYTLCCEALHDGAPTDEVRLPYGIRTCAFDADKGFLLNGAAVKLKGVCIHHDAGVLGAAVPASVWRTRFAKLREAGCNAIRFSHNPPDEALLSLCDEMGFLALDEAFDEWEGCKNKWWQGHNVYPPKHHGYAEDFPQCHEQDLAGMVRRDRNHPCVILWSIGNELDYPNDPYVHPSFASMTGNNDKDKPEEERRYDPNKPDASRLTEIARMLARIVKQHDPTRPVTAALAFPEMGERIGLLDELDVLGYNYKEELYACGHAKRPTKPLLGTENSNGAQAWLAIRDCPYVAGQFIWTGVDFLGEALGWPVRISQQGLLDTAGHRKPSWYQRRALWTKPLCAKLTVLHPNDEERFSWEGSTGETMRVRCLTNAQQATLSLNGRTIGTQTVGEDACVEWTLPFEAGSLRVQAERDGESISDQLDTPDAPSHLRLTITTPMLTADGKSLAQVEVKLTDVQGRLCTGCDRPITCQLLGDGQLMGIENGDPADLTSYAELTRPTYRGRAILYVRAGQSAGSLRIRVWRADDIASELEIPVLQAK